MRILSFFGVSLFLISLVPLTAIAELFKGHSVTLKGDLPEGYTLEMILNFAPTKDHAELGKKKEIKKCYEWANSDGVSHDGRWVPKYKTYKLTTVSKNGSSELKLPFLMSDDSVCQYKYPMVTILVDVSNSNYYPSGRAVLFHSERSSNLGYLALSCKNNTATRRVSDCKFQTAASPNQNGNSIFQNFSSVVNEFSLDFIF